jgi:hypothetical protein
MKLRVVYDQKFGKSLILYETDGNLSYQLPKKGSPLTINEEIYHVTFHGWDFDNMIIRIHVSK